MDDAMLAAVSSPVQCGLVFFLVRDLHQMVENSMKIRHKKDYDHHSSIGDDAAETKASWLKECRRRVERNGESNGKVSTILLGSL